MIMYIANDVCMYTHKQIMHQAQARITQCMCTPRAKVDINTRSYIEAMEHNKTYTCTRVCATLVNINRMYMQLQWCQQHFQLTILSNQSGSSSWSKPDINCTLWVLLSKVHHMLVNVLPVGQEIIKSGNQTMPHIFILINLAQYQRHGYHHDTCTCKT